MVLTVVSTGTNYIKNTANTNTFSKISGKRFKELGIKIGTININGGYAAKKEELVDEMVKFKLDMLGICDSRNKGFVEEYVGKEKYRVILSGVTKGKANWGVGLILSKKMEEHLLDSGRVNERIMWAKFSFYNLTVTVAVVYAPCEGCKEEEIDDFYRNLEDVMDIGAAGEIIVIGDFNSRIGKDNRGFETIMGKWGEDRDVNRNGRKLLDFCMALGLGITNSWFNHKDIHKFTWEEPTRNRKSILDYILVSKDLRRYVLDTRVFRGFEVSSDHYLVCCNLRIKYNRDSINTRTKCYRMKVESLEDRDTRCTFETRVSNEYNRIRETDEEDIETEWQGYRDILTKIGKEVLGEAVCKDNKRRSPWWTENIKTAVKAKKVAYKKWLATRSESNRQDYKDKRNAVSKSIKESKKKSWVDFGSFLENAGMEGRKLFWGVVKKLRSGKKLNMTNVKDTKGHLVTGKDKVMGRWKEYFEELLNFDDIKDNKSQDKNRAERVGTVDEEQNDISFNEVMLAIQKLKNGKAAGIDEITPELIKCSGVKGVEWMDT